MPYDLASAAALLRKRHHDTFAFRTTVLDLLFATGCSVSEQAVALDGGDALCVRASGPAAPSLQPPLVVVAVDLDPPHLSHVALQTERPAAWPPSMSSLGGPAVAVTWATILHALASSTSQRPWEAIYLRGPAHGLGAYVRAILAQSPSDAEIVQAVPSIAAELDDAIGPSDLARLDLTRSRNVWRFPACDHTYALSGAVPWQRAMPELVGTLAALGDIAWTLHDAHLYQAEAGRFAGVLRTSEPIRIETPCFRAAQMADDQRLMFPINDALGALSGLGGKLPDGWADALQRPLHMHVLPDGLRAYLRVPAGAQLDRLPDRSGTLHCDWEVEPLSVVPSLAVLPLAVGADERIGPVPPGAVMQGAVVWQTPILADDDDLVGLQRAVQGAIVPY